MRPHFPVADLDSASLTFCDQAGNFATVVIKPPGVDKGTVEVEEIMNASLESPQNGAVGNIVATTPYSRLDSLDRQIRAWEPKEEEVNLVTELSPNLDPRLQHASGQRCFKGEVSVCLFQPSHPLDQHTTRVDVPGRAGHTGNLGGNVVSVYEGQPLRKQMGGDR